MFNGKSVAGYAVTTAIAAAIVGMWSEAHLPGVVVAIFAIPCFAAQVLYGHV